MRGGAFEYGCRHRHANYGLRVLGRMRDLRTGVWVFFFFSLSFSITPRERRLFHRFHVLVVFSFLFLFLVSWRKVLYHSCCKNDIAGFSNLSLAAPRRCQLPDAEQSARRREKERREVEQRAQHERSNITHPQMRHGDAQLSNE